YRQVIGLCFPSTILTHENKNSTPRSFPQLPSPRRIPPVPHGSAAHAVRVRRRAAARQQHTDAAFAPLAGAAGIYPRDNVTITIGWSDQIGQISGRPSESVTTGCCTVQRCAPDFAPGGGGS